MTEKQFERHMEKRNVLVIRFPNILLECKECGKGWSPMFQTGGKLPRGYWKCPDGCNENVLKKD
jgi:hypothetical protein